MSLAYSNSYFSAMTEAAFLPFKLAGELMNWPMAADEVGKPHAYRPPQFDIHATTIDGEPSRVNVHHEKISPFCNLWDFTCASPKRRETALVISPNSGKSVMLMHEVIAGLLPYANVSITEWIDPRYVKLDPVKPGPTHDLEDFTDDVIEAARRRPGAYALGVSQSCVPLTVAASWIYKNPGTFKKAPPKGLILMGGPINAQLDPQAINWMARFSGDPIHLFCTVRPPYAGAGRSILPGEVQKMLFSMCPDHPLLNGETQAIPAEQVRQTLGRVFRDYHLARGQYLHRGKPIDPAAFTGKLLTVVGNKDGICAPPQTKDAHRLMPNAIEHLHHVEENAGHYDLIGGPHWAEDIAPLIGKRFLLQQPVCE